MQLDPIKALVQDDFQAVNALILDSLHSKASIINDLGRYIIQSGGKRLRPLVVILTAHASGYSGKHHINLATVIEFIHTATLLHDDVVDEAVLRRGRKTANNVWGNEAAVLVGDFLYSKAFQMVTAVENPRVMNVLANATNIMSEGEALQLLERRNAETTEGGYLNIIRSKTAKLFEASAQIGAILSNADSPLELALAQFGMHLGTAFQLIDDVLDYEASPAATGKKLGNDLAEGKVTLPLIYLLQNGNKKDTRLIQEAIRENGEQHLPVIQKMIRESGALDYTRNFAKVESARAKKALEKLNPSPYRDAAHALTDFAIDRNH
jgi:octaprenyl-diphosphate synthase